MASNYAMIVFLLFYIELKVSPGSAWTYSFSQTNFNDSHYEVFQDYLFLNSHLTLSVTCHEENHYVDVTWQSIRYQCLKDYHSLTNSNTFMSSDEICQHLSKEERFQRSEATFQSFSGTYMCSSNSFVLHNFTGSNLYQTIFQENNTCYQKSTNKTSTKLEHVTNHIASTWEEGTYIFLLNIRPVSNNSKQVSFSGLLQVQSQYGHLSPFLYQKHIIFGVASILYLLLSSSWLVVWARAQKYTSKIHVCLGLISVLASFGNILGFIDLSFVNSNGWEAQFLYLSGGSMLLIYEFFLAIAFLTASTGYHIIRPKLSNNYWTCIIFLSGTTLCLQALQMIVFKQTTGGTKDKSFHSLGKSVKSLNFIVVLHPIFMLIYSAWALYFSFTTFIYLFVRKHSSHAKFYAFSLFASSSAIIFIVDLIATLSAVVDKFSSKCPQSTMKATDYSINLLPQIKMLISIVALMFLWRPLDEFRSYGFQTLSTEENDIFVRYAKNSPNNLHNDPNNDPEELEQVEFRM